MIITWLKLAWNAVAYFLLGLVVMFTGGGVFRCISQAVKGEDVITRTGLPAYEASLPGAKIHFLATSGGDAILLESDGHFAMVDCAEDSDYPADKPGLKGPGYEKYVLDYVKRVAAGPGGKVVLDFVLGTHAHSDHIGGFNTLLLDPDVTAKKAFLQRYSAKGMNKSELSWDNTEVYQQMLDVCVAKDIPLVQDMPAEPFQLGAFTITILSGCDPPLLRMVNAGDENANSLGLLVEASGRRAFLAGDITWTSGSEMLLCGKIGKVDLLKVGHHGYAGSTGIPFAVALRPKLAVYTAWAGCVPPARFILPLFANSKQYITGDFGGIVAVFGNEVALYAIRDEPVKSP